MTLYTQQSKNIRKTWLLMGLFLVLIIVLGWFLSEYYQSPQILYFCVAFSVGMNIISYWFSDKVVLGLTHAKPVEHNDNPELYHIVENLCITAGLPIPKIYILPEAAINAFATGRDKEHAVVAVTQGALQKLNKNELEGVIAHELSHIGNYDILLQTVVVVLVGLISVISDIFIRARFWGGSRDNDNDSGGQLGSIVMLLGLIFIILSPIIAKLIQLAISRKREFLADASGSLLTRYPEGLASALEKISNDTTPMRFSSQATSHLFIATPIPTRKNATSDDKKIKRTSLFDTHPPVGERIKILRDMDI
ncbi:MAG TPA: M48 family metallopeptidase [Candidatus Paceibacterota bacterium]|nr:M48 family metallopeptidase [Candidatus Paceibacterota bacterium]HPT39997.1 M48 family metallopeptidase [Candidatus Paceibacterota bacterium]